MIEEMENDEIKNWDPIFSTMKHKIPHKETFAGPSGLDMPLFRTIETMDTPVV